MTKMDIIPKFTEKRINRWLNMCIRLPGVVLMLAFAWVAVLAGRYHIHLGLLAFQGYACARYCRGPVCVMACCSLRCSNAAFDY